MEEEEIMNITLEEQIEYMRGEVKEWQEAYACEPELSVCKAILATLEACRDNMATKNKRPKVVAIWKRKKR